MKSSEEMLLKEYASYLLSERSCSKETVEFYINDIRQFIEYMNNAGKDTVKAETEDIRTFFNSLVEMETKHTTISRKLTSIKNFFMFLLSENKT